MDYKQVVIECQMLMANWIATSTPESDKKVLSDLLGVLDNPKLVKQMKSESTHFDQDNRLTLPPEQQVTDNLANGLQKLIIDLGAKQIDFGAHFVSFYLRDMKFKLTIKQIKP